MSNYGPAYMHIHIYPHISFLPYESESEVAQSCLTLSNPWTAAYQAPPSMGFSRQKYSSGVPLLSLR